MTDNAKPQKADGAQLLDQMLAFLTRYVAFTSPNDAVAVVLWALHTWVVSTFYITPRLVLDSAEPGSGKSRVLEILMLLSQYGKMIVSASSAALYRRIAAASEEPDQPLPTILQDEADAIFGKNATPQSEDLRALYNAGYKRGATVDRCEGDVKSMRVKEFPVFAPVALAGLAGRMPQTITDRAISIHMRKRRPDQQVVDFRERVAELDAQPIREHAQLWAQANVDTLSASYPKLPEGVRDRAAEVWEPLVAIADAAGGRWPELARAACRYFVLEQSTEDEKLSLGQRLLRDIKVVFTDQNVDTMWTTDLLAALKKDDESEWRDLWGKALDARRLANELKRYGIRSKGVRQGIAVAKGYEIDGANGLGQAWEHWLPVTSVTAVTNGAEQGKDRNGPVTDNPSAVTVRNVLTSNVTAVTAVTDKSGSDAVVFWERCRHCDDPLKFDDDRRTGWHSDRPACVRAQQTHQRHLKAVPESREGTSRAWAARYIAEQQAAGITTIRSADAVAAGQAEGFERAAVVWAINRVPGVDVIARDGDGVTWSITGERVSTYEPVSVFIEEYIASTFGAAGGIVDKTDYRSKGEAADLKWENLRKAIRNHPRIELVNGETESRRHAKWAVLPDADEGVGT